ncbi:hypothetical protein [Paenibacillus sp. JMULE4]|nr:hypothetical protein [Paenibacillus sp. JMULE4]
MAANTGIHTFLAGYTPKPAMVSGFLSSSSRSQRPKALPRRRERWMYLLS